MAARVSIWLPVRNGRVEALGTAQRFPNPARLAVQLSFCVGRERCALANCTCEPYTAAGAVRRIGGVLVSRLRAAVRRVEG